VKKEERRREKFAENNNRRSIVHRGRGDELEIRRAHARNALQLRRRARSATGTKKRVGAMLGTAFCVHWVLSQGEIAVLQQGRRNSEVPNLRRGDLRSTTSLDKNWQVAPIIIEIRPSTWLVNRWHAFV
jgi:hypothetical protein